MKEDRTADVGLERVMENTWAWGLAWGQSSVATFMSVLRKAVLGLVEASCV